MKGVLLAGGKGTRLYPLTKSISKHLLTVYDKPMAFYPLSVLFRAKIRDILIISTPKDLPKFESLLKDGSQFGVRFEYKVQQSPNGIAEALLIGADFIGNDNVALILGDNLFDGKDFEHRLGKAIENVENNGKSAIFAYKVSNPDEFGVVEFDNCKNVVSIEEKPNMPKSNYCVTGLYMYSNDAICTAGLLTPSKRGELEITDLNRILMSKHSLDAEILPDDYMWIDMGTHKGLNCAAKYVERMKKAYDISVADLMMIARQNGWIY